MSKSAEDRISELENSLKDLQGENRQLSEHYSQAYRKMEEASNNAMYYKGLAEAAVTAPSQEEDSSYSGYDSGDVDAKSMNAALEKLIAERLEPRMQAVERYATDALQQTAGREVDLALKSFRAQHPESERVMDFNRLVMLDASDEVKRRQHIGQPIEDVKAIALEFAEKRVKAFNKMESDISERNKKRRDKAESKAMLPDIFASAGFEESPSAPGSIQEAGDLLERLVISRKGNAA
jgi:hypothetical protein